MKKTINGITVEGSKEYIIKTFSQLGYEIHESESKGLILLSEMNPAHLRNSILSRFKKVCGDMEPEIFSQIVRKLNCIADTALNNLISEMIRRYPEGLLDAYDDDYESDYEWGA